MTGAVKIGIVPSLGAGRVVSESDSALIDDRESKTMFRGLLGNQRRIDLNSWQWITASK